MVKTTVKNSPLYWDGSQWTNQVGTEEEPKPKEEAKPEEQGEKGPEETGTPTPEEEPTPGPEEAPRPEEKVTIG